MNELQKRLLELAHRGGALEFSQRLDRDADQPLYVLAYHRVAQHNHGSRLDPTLLSASPAQFDDQMRLLAQRYHPVSAEEALKAAEDGAPLPRNAVLVTVDDGYRDFQEAVFPIANRYGIRPILFVPTGFVGRGVFWWDQLYDAIQRTPFPEIPTPLGPLSLRSPEEKKQALERLRAYVKQSPFRSAQREIEALCEEIAPSASPPERATLDWDELRALAQAGVTIAAHTHTHPILSHIPLDQVGDEIRASQRFITQEIGQALPIFAFPDGTAQAFTPEVVSLLGSEGFKLAWTMVEGRTCLRRDDLLRLPRLVVRGAMSLAQFHLRLIPVYDLWKRRQHRP
jgi:peptidoglycan/xylan/chitin deacetylase (PgdA/CDA1 family)